VGRLDFCTQGIAADLNGLGVLEDEVDSQVFHSCYLSILLFLITFVFLENPIVNCTFLILKKYLVNQPIQLTMEFYYFKASLLMSFKIEKKTGE
jgi:hypothetical protein